MISTVIGGVTGAIGGKGANGAELRKTYSIAADKLTRAVSTKKIIQYTAKIAYVKDKATTSIVNTLAIGIINNHVDKRLI